MRIDSRKGGSRVWRLPSLHLPYPPHPLPRAYPPYTIPQPSTGPTALMSTNQPTQNQPTPTIKSLGARDADKNARAALNQRAIYIAELDDGRFAICDRAQAFYLVVDGNISYETFSFYKRMLETSRMAAEASYHGEPTPRELATDLRSARTFSPRKSSTPDLDIEIEL